MPLTAGAPLTRYWAAAAWLGGDRLSDDVLVEVDGERIARVTSGVAAPPDAERLSGVVLPGLANAHSHAFHRALRGRGAGRGSFWTWREGMYAIAARLTPDTYGALARATFAEMALAGITAVGEFHYVHHTPDGTPYDDPDAMAVALAEAAAAAGIRLTLLDTCYLRGGFGRPLEGVQRRFGDGDATGWAERAGRLRPAATLRVGAAIHSVRAVPADQLATVAAWAQDRGAPLHVHLSEQRAENTACLEAHGCTPTALLEAHEVLGPRTVAVHATHADGADVLRLGRAGCGVCLCPTTERDLGDGLGPARALADAGVPLSVGSDGHTVIDLFEEARSVELHERLRSERRGCFEAAELLTAASPAGHAAIGWEGAGRIAAGMLADLVAVRVEGLHMAGSGAGRDPGALVATATSGDVGDVLVGGRRVVRDGRHLLVDDPAAAMSAAVTAVLPP